MKIGFIGAGRWALALACRLHEQGATVALHDTNASYLAQLRDSRHHPDLPESVTLPPSTVLSEDIATVAAGAAYVFFATPSSALGAAARAAAPHIGDRVKAVVTVTKGIDTTTLRRLSLVLADALPSRPIVVLAGPGIPYDFALGDPTSLVAAAEDEPAAELVRDSMTAGNLRIYSSGDVVGVELGAALKNVFALAGGIIDGLELGINAKAALLTRGLAEMTRLGIAMNANPLTFAGLSGVGDLIVTAFSSHSRNHELGRLLGSGVGFEEACSRLNGVAEGAATVVAARALAQRHHVNMPITEEIFGIVHQGVEPRRSLSRLLRRSPKKETPHQ